MSPFSGRKKIQRAIHSGVVLVEQRATLARHPKAVLMNKNGSRYYAMKLIECDIFVTERTIKFLNYFSFGFIISSVWQYRKVEKTAEIANPKLDNPRIDESRLPRWPSGCKCDCRVRGLGFDSRVGRSITGLFSVFRIFLSDSTESGNVPVAILRVI
uniref:SFRICE_005083 n=1 Tax=Spodoptera frugiperda TaxID=7108 RepID=A0A2H1VJQ1_SPOFR